MELENTLPNVYNDEILSCYKEHNKKLSKPWQISSHHHICNQENTTPDQKTTKYPTINFFHVQNNKKETYIFVATTMTIDAVVVGLANKNPMLELLLL